MFEIKGVLSKLRTIVFIFTAISYPLVAMDLKKLETVEHTEEHKVENTISEKELLAVALAISKHQAQIMDLATRAKDQHQRKSLRRWLKRVEEKAIQNPEKGFVVYKEGVTKFDVAKYIMDTLQKPDKIYVHDGKVVVRKAISDGFKHVSDKSVMRDISFFELEINLESVKKELDITGIHKYIGDKAELIHAYPTE